MLHKEDGAPEKKDPEPDEDGAGNFIDNRKGMQCEAAPQLTCHHDLPYVGAHIDQETNGEDNDTFL